MYIKREKEQCTKNRGLPQLFLCCLYKRYRLLYICVLLNQDADDNILVDYVFVFTTIHIHVELKVYMYVI